MTPAMLDFLRPRPSSTTARVLGFGPDLSHVIAVPPGPDDRPGYRLLAPSRSLHPPEEPVEVDGSRTDFRVALTSAGATLGGVCLGRVADRGTPDRVARHGHPPTLRPHPDVPEPTADRICGEEAVRHDVLLGRHVLTDWLLERRGWLFVVGALRSRGEPSDRVLLRAREVLATWQWVDEPPSTPEGWDDEPPELPSWPSAGRSRKAHVHHRVVVEATVGGAGGYEVHTPGAPPCGPVPGVDGARTDFIVSLVGAATLQSSVVGRVERTGDAIEGLRREAAAPTRAWRRRSPVTEVPLAGERAGHLREQAGGRTVHVWALAHEGWAHRVVLTATSEDDEARALQVAEAVFASWRWREA